MNKHSWKVAAIFSIIVFLIITTTMFLSFILMILIYQLGILDKMHRSIPIAVFALISVIIGTLISKFSGKRPLQTIIEISKATQEVAKGNFDLKLNEDIRAIELREMAHNFNIMTSELANTEIFRNDFIHNVSHEFKTPLAAIDGYATLLQNKSLSKEKYELYVSKIIYNTHRLTSLTDNILQIARLENQETDIKKDSYSLDEQLREIILLFESAWTEKNLELDINLEAVNYNGNSELLAQVWQNLIGNAIKFSKYGGTIQVILKQEENGLSVSIVDNGIGMDDQIQKRLFEKFYQGDTSRASEGNGLGLTLAKRIVDLHGGSINVASKTGKGSTFTVKLP